MPVERLISQEPKKENGVQPHFLILKDPSEGSFLIFGPYSQDFGEHMQETFGGTLVKEQLDSMPELWPKENDQ